MNTKFASFVLALGLAAMACSMTGPTLYVQSDVRMATVTRTPEPSPTYTFTPIPPTNTATPTKTATPTSTPTPRVPMAKVVADTNVIIRLGPCYQEPISQAEPGMVFPVTGWYRSAQGEEWMRIQFHNAKGLLLEGWVRADLVEVTNSDLVAQVFANCPPTKTPTPTKTSTPTHSPLDVYIRVYEHRALGGDFLDINLTDCGIVNMNRDGKFNDSISSFELFAPANVEVVLAEHQYRDERFPGKTGRWHGNNGRLQVDVAELRALGLQDKISSVIWLVNGELPERTYCQR